MRLLLPVPVLKSSYDATAVKVPFTIFLLPDRVPSLDVAPAAPVATKIARLRSLVHNTLAVLCSSGPPAYSVVKRKTIVLLFRGKCLWLALIPLFAALSPAQQLPPARAEDVGSVDAVITASYAAISHAPGKAADLQRFQSLFRPGAQLINMDGQDGRPAMKAGTIEQITKMLQSTQHPERGHFEKEIARRTEQYGNVAHAWSTYESTDTENGRKSCVRGINSISLINDGQRWWIASAQWTYETKARPIPRRYLGSKK